MARFIVKAVSFLSGMGVRENFVSRAVKKSLRSSSVDLTSFNFDVVDDFDGDEATVFVHGYSASSSPELRAQLRSYIAPSSILPGQKKIIAFWDSGHWGNIFDGGLDAAIDSVVSMNIISPLLKSRFDHFDRYKSRADDYSSNFISQVGYYVRDRHPKVRRVNFIGHSLGGRLILKSLVEHCYPDGFEIGDVLLMAAAVAAPEEKKVLKMNKIVSGRVVNAYSPSDIVLSLNHKECCVGAGYFYKVDNFLMSGFRHGDYWKKLKFVLDSSGFSCHYRSPVKKSGFKVHGRLPG